jgi:hypothetical protein
VRSLCKCIVQRLHVQLILNNFFGGVLGCINGAYSLSQVCIPPLSCSPVHIAEVRDAARCHAMLTRLRPGARMCTVADAVNKAIDVHLVQQVWCQIVPTPSQQLTCHSTHMPMQGYFVSHPSGGIIVTARGAVQDQERRLCCCRQRNLDRLGEGVVQDVIGFTSYTQRITSSAESASCM